MEKKKIEVHAFTVHLYFIAVVCLSLLLIVLGLKYIHLKLALHGFTTDTMRYNAMQMPKGNISDYAKIIAATVSQYPTTSPLYTQPALQNYVAALSKDLNRDIVILDTNKKVLADTVPTNIGTNYSYDQQGEIRATLKDGVSRTFVEKSTDYPNGISEVVVSMKNDKNQIIGVVIVSNVTLGK